MYQLITNILAPVRMELDPRTAVWIQFYWIYRMMNIITNRTCYGCYDWIEYECHACSLPYSSHLLMLMFLITVFGQCKPSLNLTFLEICGRLNLWVCRGKGTLINGIKPQRRRDMYPIGTIMYQLITNILPPVRIGLDPLKAVWIQF